MSALKSRYKIWILYIRLLLFTIPTTRDRRTSNRCSLKHRTRVAYFRWPKYKKTNINALSCPHKGWIFPQDLFWGSFTSHNSGNYLRHGINITTNQRLSPTFRGNGNTIIVGDSPFFLVCLRLPVNIFFYLHSIYFSIYSLCKQFISKFLTPLTPRQKTNGASLRNAVWF